jgi:hypothetical protein
MSIFLSAGSWLTWFSLPPEVKPGKKTPEDDVYCSADYPRWFRPHSVLKNQVLNGARFDRPACPGTRAPYQESL